GSCLSPLRGFLPLIALYGIEREPLRRRQMGGALWAMGLTWTGLIDMLVAYGIAPVPVAWLFEAAGLMVAMRALLFDDLMRARAIDVRTPVVIAYLVLAVVAGW